MPRGARRSQDDFPGDPRIGARRPRGPGGVSGAVLIAIAATLLPAAAFAGGGPQNVLVVMDETLGESVAIGQYYAAARDIPARNLLYLFAPQLNDFDDVINNLANPIKDACLDRGIEDQIDYIVLTKGIPYKFSGLRDSVASILFSEATDVWPDPFQCTLGGWQVRNPYFPKAEYFDYNEQYVRGAIPLMNRRLVMMLSGFTIAGAWNNIDAGVASDETAPTGTVYFISAVPAENVPRLWPRHDAIPHARAALMSLGVASQHRIVTSETEDSDSDGCIDSSLCDTPDVMGYLTGATRVEVLSNTYLPGAVADHMTSFGGDLLNAGGQMSILEFTDAGVSGSSGTVTEPCNYAQKFVNPSLYERYAIGFNLAESLWMNINVSWQTIMVGDPLAQPWGVKPVVTIDSPAPVASVRGDLIQLDATATHPRGDCLSRMELLVNGELFQTLADLTAPAGNEVTLTVDGTPITYTCLGGEDSYDILSGLINQPVALANATLVDPGAPFGRSAYIKVVADTAGTAGNGIPVSISVSQGSGSELGVAARVSSGTLAGGMDATPELGATYALSHVFVTVGSPTIHVNTPVDLSPLPGGIHELRVVAYQGDRIFTQGYDKVSVDTRLLIGDIDESGGVNLADFATMARCFNGRVFQPPVGCEPYDALASDLDGDRLVTVNDFGLLALHFLEEL